MGDLLTLPRPNRTPADAELDMPPCGNTWGPADCADGGPHTCRTWQGWPHTCRCMHCHYRGYGSRIALAGKPVLP